MPLCFWLLATNYWPPGIGYWLTERPSAAGYWPTGQATENTEKFDMTFALQLIRCPFLNPRIRGVTILTDIIDITVRSGIR